MTNFDRATRVAAGIGLVALGGVAFLALVIGLPASTASGGMGTMGGGGMMGGPGFPVVLYPLVLLAFTALLAFGYAGVRAVASASDDAPTDDSEESDPIARLQRRYTEGELTEEEFERALDREFADKALDGDEERNGTERSAPLRER
ncbi:hypothetical protein C471_00245 [Halorubrum saccharovorum DSM 1137]|uniref:SHOCT domain-containing protein n=1 Tax=Halorubrum saccharovorum DSM 1137 TaxID=1227484 RepID=M0E6U9_9EURY|nr:SHOCT domain-containing protein [Halorubrum saccharovorum]ELZ43501.1 hypothetical protein C471_00245 [Halorubrum saccharovorum DSM 1137]